MTRMDAEVRETDEAKAGICARVFSVYLEHLVYSVYKSSLQPHGLEAWER